MQQGSRSGRKSDGTTRWIAPHGFGHNRAGIRMAIAGALAGVSCNDVTDELILDPLSGNAAVNGVLVEGSPA